METVLTIRNAVKAFGVNKALDNVSLELHKGEWLALLGPNGAGKTTLVRSIAGRVKLDSGTITLPGTKNEMLGIVPQEIALYPKLTARENLSCFGQLMNISGALLKERVDWALEFTGLADRANELVHTFSGGMKRRLNIACSVLHRPSVVLLDEPTVGVDPQSRQRIWEMLDRLRRDGASLLLTTHQLDEAQQNCDRIVVIDHGRVIADGTFDELVRDTIGSERRVSLTLESGGTIQGEIRNIASDLSTLLSQAASQGATIVDVQVESPTLQAVFLHLTGRELPRLMIPTIMKISLMNLRRDKVAFMMTFVLPVIFFSIFAMIFGATDRGTKDNKIKVVVADLDNTEVSRRFVATLRKQAVLNVTAVPDEAAGRKLVHDGKFPVAIVVLQGFSGEFGNFASANESIELIYDAANPIAQNAVGGLLQAAAMMSAPDVLIEKGFSSMENLGAGLTPQQRQALDTVRPYMRGDAGSSRGGDAMQGMLKIRSTDVRAGEAQTEQHSMIAYYAAGIGVMFLLFSMAGAGGAFLDETESGTLERLLSTNASMSQVLIAKWLFLMLVGLMQVTVMFLWATFVFHLELFTPARLAGFAAMAITTAAGAAAFGLVLAAACKTRAQLSGISTIVILIMSALGGSMVPRFIMPKFMETTALFTFNGWALDGFLKVFWYGESSATVGQSLTSLIPQLVVLSSLAAVFLVAARTLARRWETV